MLRDELKNILGMFFTKITEQDINVTYEVLKTFSTKQVEFGIKAFFQDGGKTLDNFRKYHKKYIFVKTVTATQSYNYPNKETEDFVEKLLNDIEYLFQKKVYNEKTAISRVDRSNYEKISLYEVNDFNTRSKTFDIQTSGEVKIKQEIQSVFIEATNKLINNVTDWMRLDKPLFDLCKINLKENICLAFCNMVWDNVNLLYSDWIRDIFIDLPKLNQMMIKYINWRQGTNHDTSIEKIIEKIAA